MDITNAIAVVSGGASGLGNAVARRVVDEGDSSGREGEELDAFCLAQTHAIMAEVLDAG